MLGTCLAFRALLVLLTASMALALAMGEQPRLSKMAWLPEWRALLRLFPRQVQEIWFASCAYHQGPSDGPLHRKEFRMITANFPEAQSLHRKCPRDHQHVRVEGSYTRGTAVYNSGVSHAIADIFA